MLRSAALCKNLGNATMGPLRSEVLQVVKRAAINWFLERGEMMCTQG